MIDIRSYLRTPEGTFVPVEDAAFRPLDPDYIHGAIELSIDGKILLDQALWDYVDVLWVYISDATEELIRQGHGETLFPDQPIRFAMRRVPRDLVVVSVESVNVPRRAAAANIRDLLQAFYLHTEDFFEKMSDLAGGKVGAYTKAVQRFRQAAISVGAWPDSG